MIKIKFETENDAFCEDFELESKRILEEIKKFIGRVEKNSAREYPIKDISGNKIGLIQIDRHKY